MHFRGKRPIPHLQKKSLSSSARPAAALRDHFWTRLCGSIVGKGVGDGVGAKLGTGVGCTVGFGVGIGVLSQYQPEQPA